jgi:hypothetical protein
VSIEEINFIFIGKLMKSIYWPIIIPFAFCAVSCNDAVKPVQIPGICKANFSTKGIYIYIFKNGTCKFQDSLNQKADIKTAR